MSIIDKIMGRNNNDLSKVFANEKTSISAATAYQKSRFGMVKTDKELLEEFFIDIKDLNEKRYSKYTGKNNDYVLKNLLFFVENNLLTVYN